MALIGNAYLRDVSRNWTSDLDCIWMSILNAHGIGTTTLDLIFPFLVVLLCTPFCLIKPNSDFKVFFFGFLLRKREVHENRCFSRFSFQWRIPITSCLTKSIFGWAAKFSSKSGILHSPSLEWLTGRFSSTLPECGRGTSTAFGCQFCTLMGLL